MGIESKELPSPVQLKSIGKLITNHDELFEAMHMLIPDLTERESERVDSNLTDLLDSLVKGKGHLPRYVVPTPGKGEMTHILNGRLLRKEGIWIGLHVERGSMEPPQIISLNRGNTKQLSSILGGGPFRGAVRREAARAAKQQGQSPIPKFHKQGLRKSG